MDPDGVAAVNSKGESHLQAVNEFPSSRFAAAKAGYIIGAVCYVKHGPVAQDETEREEPLLGDSVVIVSFPNLIDISGCGIADSAKGRALEGNCWR